MLLLSLYSSFVPNTKIMLVQNETNTPFFGQNVFRLLRGITHDQTVPSRALPAHTHGAARVCLPQSPGCLNEPHPSRLSTPSRGSRGKSSSPQQSERRKGTKTERRRTLSHQKRGAANLRRVHAAAHFTESFCKTSNAHSSLAHTTVNRSMPLCRFVLFAFRNFFFS